MNPTIVITVVSFIICYTTQFLVLNVLVAFQYKIPLWPYYVIRELHYANIIVNFFVYATKIREFRLAAQSLIFHIQTPIETS